MKISNSPRKSRFKGAPPKRFKLFTYRNSGGFYLGAGQGENLSTEYLLFLDPWQRPAELPSAARGAMGVNYACGKSGPWDRVTPEDQAALKAAAGRRLK